MAKGMGFKAAAASVAKREGLPMKNADAIIGAAKNKAMHSKKAVKANPNLLNLPGGKRAKAPK